MKPRRSHSLLALLLPLVLALPAALEAQSVLDRSPNVPGTWVGEPGSLHFHFLHRFNQTGGVVSNSPTLLLAAPLPGRTLAGARWASNSRVVQGETNEWEIFGRWAALEAADGAPVDLSVTGAYHPSAESVDGELAVGLPLGRARILGLGRVFSDAYGGGEADWAAGGGASLRLTDGVALAGDAIYTPASDDLENRTVAWSAALQLQVPLTPHTLSIQAANTPTSTLQGSSLGLTELSSDAHRISWGFEFTIPFTFSRYFGGGAGGQEAVGGDGGEGGDGATVSMSDLRYRPSTVRIRAGETVRWHNDSQVIHTVTADPDRAVDESNVSLPEGAAPFDSGDLRPDETWARTFDTPGEYVYFCVPHEAAGMVGWVIVAP